MDVGRYVEHRRRCIQRRESESRQRATAERARLPAIAGALERFGVTRVLLFGSLAAGRLDEGSDIDLAVEGLPPGALFDARAEAEAEAGRPVDLLRLEDAPPRLRARIEREGEVLRGG